MGKAHSTPTVTESNRDYFLALSNTRAALARLALLPSVTIFILLILNFRPFSPPPGYLNYEVVSVLGHINRALIGVSAVIVVLSLMKKVVYRAQAFFSYVMAGTAAAAVYSVCLMFMVIATLPKVRTGELDPVLFNVIGLAAAVLTAGATGVHLLLLRHRLRVGHSEKRRVSNFLAVSGSNRSKVFWVTFGVVAVVPNILTRGQYLATSFGALSVIVISSVMTSLPVEFGYLAYLKSKDRTYWEGTSRGRRKGRGR